ncbi:helix-turn-helix domain-containing protein [Butyribacter intestini]|jgi:DNA-binding Xre family transcriptional regulator|uniref:helix-turn-helix domain-containing protein n=1 Tax=Butyribacter intestini TaxID=1703332 RepID=UPI0020592EBD|nr:helix-turn-helix transcriptional regulator [Butyribacter intestini]DAV57229.1 MAG TPA: Cro/C1-type HTH DNA-binding domain protein [Caudoviricetes sp.]
MDTTKMIKKLLVDKEINTVELAKRLGCGTANIYNKYKRNNFSVNELEEIANAVGCQLVIIFKDK